MRDDDKTKEQLLEELAELRQALDGLMNNLPEGILLVDAPSAKIRMASRYGREMIGVSWKEIERIEGDEHFRYYRVYHLDGTEAKLEQLPLARVLACGEVIRNEEWLLQPRAGRRIPMVCHAGPIRQQDGTIAGAVISWQDVTDRKQAEAALRESQQRFGLLVETIPQIVWWCDPEGNVLECSRYWCEYTGYTMEESTGKNWMKALHPDDLARVSQRIGENRPQGEVYQSEHRLRRASDGAYRWHLARTAPLKDEAGNIIGWIGSTTDIDDQKRAEEALELRVQERTADLSIAVEQLRQEVEERRRAEEALRQSHDELQAIYDQVVDGIVIVDIEAAQPIRTNAAVCQMLGYCEEEMRTITTPQVHPPESMPDVWRHIEAVAQGKVVRFENMPFLRKNGSVFYADVISSRIRYNGRLCRISFLHDVTERMKAQAARERERRTLEHMLRASDHERQLIAYDIHDGLAQQLAGAIMQFQMYDHQKDAKPQDAEKAFDGGMALLRQGHFEARRLISGVRPPILDESGVVAAIAHLANERSLEKGPEVEFYSRVKFTRLASILENAIYRIVQEGLTNACKHSKSQRVRISLRQRDAQVHIHIRDWGIGFDPKAVYDNRYGLPGMRERARVLGGKCRVRSKLGQGTAVVVKLPVVPSNEDE